MNQTLITAREVGQFVSSYSLSRRGFFKDNEIFEDLLDLLSDMIALLKTQTQDALNRVFVVKSVQELQRKIDDLNASGLRNFANEALKQAIYSNSGFHMPSSEDVIEGVIQYMTRNSEATLDTIGETANLEAKMVNAFTTAIEGGRAERSNSTTVKSATITKKIQEILGGKKVKLDSYKRDIVIFLQKEAEKNDASFVESTWAVNVPDIETIDVLSFYPYFNLTARQKEIALNTSSGDGARAWSNFKQHLISFVHYPDFDVNKANQILDQLGPAAFIQNNTNGVLGVLGEVQVGFIFSIFPGLKVTMTPNELSARGGKLRADLLIEGAGVQVKNYSSYEYKGLKGFNLSDTLSFSTIQKRAVVGDLESLGDYLSVVNYNQPLKTLDDKAPYRILYNNLTAKSNAFNNILNATLAANIDVFFQLFDKIAGENEIVSDAFNNLFFVFGGTTIIPTWSLLQSLYNKIVALKEALASGGKGGMANFRSTTSYSGPVWNWDKKPRKISEVLDALKVHINFNIYLGDLDLT